MFGLGVPELLIILFLVLLLFGARKLPDLASGLGGAVNAFRKSLKGDDEPVKTIDGRASDADEPVPAHGSAKTESKT